MRGTKGAAVARRGEVGKGLFGVSVAIFPEGEGGVWGRLGSDGEGGGCVGKLVAVPINDRDPWLLAGTSLLAVVKEGGMSPPSRVLGVCKDIEGDVLAKIYRKTHNH